MLEKITIRGLGPCRETTIQFDRRLSALVGLNGVGKTSILRAIRSMAGRAVSAIASPSQGDFGFDAQIKILLYRYYYKYRLEFRPVSDTPVTIHHLDVSEELHDISESSNQRQLFTVHNGTLKDGLASREISINPFTSGCAALQGLLKPDDPLVIAIRPFSDFMAAIQYYPVYEQADVQEGAVAESDYQEWRQKYLSDRQTTSSVAHRLRFMQTEQPDKFQELQQLLGPNGLDLVSASITESKESSNGDVSGSGNVFFPLFHPSSKMGGAGRALPLYSLSDGTRRAVQLMVSLVFDDRALMLVEHPEDSIHLGLLQKIVDLFRVYSPRSQIILSTHSPYVLDMLEPQEVKIVTAVNGDTKARDMNENEIKAADEFRQSQGPLSDFLETVTE